MERSEILATMSKLKLFGMKSAFDQIVTAAVKRQHEPQRIGIGLEFAGVDQPDQQGLLAVGVGLHPVASVGDLEVLEPGQGPGNHAGAKA